MQFFLIKYFEFINVGNSDLSVNLPLYQSHECANVMCKLWTSGNPLGASVVPLPVLSI